MIHKNKHGFSLVEMMVVMLLVAIVLAATAPMITRKVSRERSDKIFDVLPSDPTNAVEYVKGRNQRIFMNGRDNGYVGIVETGVNIPNNSIMFGKRNNTGGTNLVSIGFNTLNKEGSVAIGSSATADGINSVAIGYLATAKKGSTMTGVTTHRKAKNAVALGYNSLVTGDNSVAIGSGSRVKGIGSTAIGYNSEAPYNHTIVLGTEEDTVYIPGSLVVEHAALIGRAAKANDNLYFRPYAQEDGRHFAVLNAGDWKGGDSNVSMAQDEEAMDTPQELRVVVGPYATAGEPWRTKSSWSLSSAPDYSDNNRTHIHYHDATKGNQTGSHKHSDIRLKNVGEKFTGGLEELNKLSFYNFTFKNDKAKTPHVGVIAQDLQKVFPAAVHADEDGWLVIRWDEMFYAALNAIKDLNTKVSELASKVCKITKDVTDIKSTLEKQQATIDSQAKLIESQQAELKKLSAKVEKLERSKK